jgi:hypothetical protein
MQAQTETFVGNRPPDPAVSPLPPLHTLDTTPGRMLFVIPVIADYRELEPVIAKALVKRSARPFDVPGLGAVTAQFGKVTCYGTTGGKVAVGVQFAANGAHGTVWLTGTPVNSPNSREVSFADLAVSGVTDSTGTDVLLALANTPGLSQTIAAALGQNFENDYTKLMGKIDRALTEKRTGDFVIRADRQCSHRPPQGCWPRALPAGGRNGNGHGQPRHALNRGAKVAPCPGSTPARFAADCRCACAARRDRFCRSCRHCRVRAVGRAGGRADAADSGDDVLFRGDHRGWRRFGARPADRRAGVLGP